MALKVTLLIYGWMSTPVVLIIGGLILIAKFKKIKQKYFQIIKYIYAQNLNKQGFIKTRFLIRKRKLIDIHRQILKTVLFFIGISEVILNLRKLKKCFVTILKVLQIKRQTSSMSLTYFSGEN